MVEDDNKTRVLAKLSPLTVARFEPVGRWFEAHGLRRLHQKSLSHNSIESSTSEASSAELSDNEENDAFLRSLDPTDWKNQDHYAVLGLGKLRYKASELQVKKAFKKKVLRHHPDKRKSRGLDVNDGDDDYFSCITKANEVLGNAARRRAYDSVDPSFDDDVPSVNQSNKDKFFDVFGPVFEANARWSNKKRVPNFGDMGSTFEDVNKFYNFWYDFDSWREYSYLDEEEKEKGENREERRWIDKQNKAERQRRKKEEVTRIRTLVDNAYACDPRIQKFKDEEKEKKLAQKRAKQEAARLRAEEEVRVKKAAEEEARKKKEKEEAEAKAQAAALKKEKEAQKRVLKKERKTFRTALQEFDYFATDADNKVSQMQDVDRLAESLSAVCLQELNKELTSGDKVRARTAFNTQVQIMNDKLAKEKEELLAKLHRTSGASGTGGAGSGKNRKWKDDETTMLIKAVNLFPAGTVQRWETVANFINQHCGSSFNAKESLNKAKDLQKMDPSAMKEEANKKAYDKFSKGKEEAPAVHIQDKISERYDSAAVQQVAEMGTNAAPWSADEQKLLEQALKSFPASTPERWERIAESVRTRSKKDCMKRYKELVEMIRAKKAAAQAAAKIKPSAS
ncbi:dnaJ homolog subfamily C member 2-like [Tubulanus polymorphus]|uniref:dnaJ homolog subfamily C member 2-like n=1 Tax=Tubulanus polymorphus TaxID=672921 RepID=UPI003DA4FC6E